jgi:hypothetical protein
MNVALSDSPEYLNDLDFFFFPPLRSSYTAPRACLTSQKGHTHK